MKTFTRRTFQMWMSSLKGCTHVLRCNWVWCLLGTLKLFRSCPLCFERWNEPLRFLTLLALKIHVVRYCKSADSQQTEGQAPATLVWFGLFKQLNEWQSLNVFGEVQRAVRRIYWKGAGRGSYPVTGAFAGGKKQLCPNVSWEFANLLLSLSPHHLHSLSSIGKALGVFSPPCEAVITQNELTL